MKLLTGLMFSILFTFLLSSCQKELHFPAHDAQGTLKADSSSDCLPSLVHGTFIQHAVLGDTNYIELDVNVTLTGQYSIQSDTLNGYSFSGSGNFDSTGINRVRLYAAGTALSPGINTFAIHFDSSICSIAINVIVPTVIAGYSFPDCNGLVVYGNYTEGIPTDVSDSLAVAITVNTPGNYLISTDSVNGVQFSVNAGFTSTASPQTVTIIGHGIPLSAGIFNYTIQGGCTFSVTYAPAPIDSITCNIDGVFTSFNVGDSAHLNNLSTPTMLYITGLASTTSNEQLVLTVQGIASTDITTNTYDVNLPPAAFFVEGIYTDNTSTGWLAKTTGSVQTPAFAITVTSFSIAPGGRIRGTFSGPVKNNAGNGPAVKMIANGMFNLLLR